MSPVAVRISLPRCPTFRPPAAPHHAATSRFVQPGAVRLRLCRYDGPVIQLIRERTIRNRATIAALIRALNRLPTVRPGMYNCPADTGSEVALLFAYANGGVSRIVVGLSGCHFVTNGRSARTGEPPLVLRLSR